MFGCDTEKIGNILLLNFNKQIHFVILTMQAYLIICIYHYIFPSIQTDW